MWKIEGKPKQLCWRDLSAGGPPMGERLGEGRRPPRKVGEWRFFQREASSIFTLHSYMSIGKISQQHDLIGFLKHFLAWLVPRVLSEMLKLNKISGRCPCFHSPLGRKHWPSPSSPSQGWATKLCDRSACRGALGFCLQKEKALT